MKTHQCAPVLLTVFNRPDKTAQMVTSLKEIKPCTIFVSADGPRPGRPEDLELCDRVRSIVLDQIDWGAEVITDFAPTNLGLRKRMATAISWALSRVDNIIVLEDDCIPDPLFFAYFSELLKKYSAYTYVGSITGDNFQPRGFDCGASYYFSRYPHCWWWAGDT